MITRIIASRFKSLPTGTDLPLAPVTLLVGPNSSGKSSAIQVLLLISQTLGSKVESQALVLNGPIGKLGGLSDIRHAGTSAETMSLGFEVSDDSPDIDRLFENSKVEVSTSSQMAELRTIDCEITFGPSGDGTEELAQLTPLLRELRLHSNAVDQVVGSEDTLKQTVTIRVKRSIRTPQERLEEMGLSAAPSHVLAALDYEVSVQADPSIDLRSDTEIVGCSLNHFLPSRLLLRYDETLETAKYLAEVVTEVDSETRLTRLMHTTSRSRAGSVPDTIPPELLVWLKRHVGEEFPVLFQSIDPDLFSSAGVELPIPVREFVARKHSLRSGQRIRLRKSLLPLREEIIELLMMNKAPVFRLTLVRLPRDLLEIEEFVQATLVANLRYLGPLRDEPKPLYPLATADDPTDVGLRGEYTAAVLNLHRKTTVTYVPSAHFEQFHGRVPLATTDLHQAVRDWLQYLEVASDVQVVDRGKYGHEMRVQPANTRPLYDLTHVGVGVSQVLPIVVMCLLAPRDSTVILEQPELHLHPSVQSRLADFFIATGLSGVQLLIETHSEYIFNRLRLRIAMADTDALAHVAHVYFVQNKEGNTSFTPVSLNRYGAVPDWPTGFFDQSQRDSEQILAAAMLKRRLERGSGK